MNAVQIHDRADDPVYGNLVALIELAIAPITREKSRPIACFAASAAIDAGWRPPVRVIETTEELAGLPSGVVIRDEDGDVFGIVGTTLWATQPWDGEGKDFGYGLEAATLPATVLWTPEETHDA